MGKTAIFAQGKLGEQAVICIGLEAGHRLASANPCLLIGLLLPSHCSSCPWSCSHGPQTSSRSFTFQTARDVLSCRGRIPSVLTPRASNLRSELYWSRNVRGEA